jgi:hypothetical protein
MDFHVEATSTESPGFISTGVGNTGNLNYWNSKYHDGYTNNGNVLGNTVGRDGRAIQCWLTYWISPENTVRLTYKHSSVSPDFIPGGGAWQDYGIDNEIRLRAGFYVKSRVQYERISRFPILFLHAERNVAAIVEMGYSPSRKN